MLTPTSFNAFCQSLPVTTHVVQWGGADVWKVGGKVFAIGAWHHGKHAGITFKASKIAFEMLSDAPGCRPAPYLASRGMSWVQVYNDTGLRDDSVKDHLVASYDLVVAGLTKKKRLALGLG